MEDPSKDLPRTVPNHPALDENGRNAFRRLLTAYARHNPMVGYCQAMNFFAGLLLLMPEKNAFWTLTGIIDDYFDGYYSEQNDRISGKLRDGRTVAVKRLHERNRRVEQFTNEIEILSRLRHKNLVTLYGCTSHHSRELLLVYEYVPNGTLADHLHGPLASKHELRWPIRMSIIIQTADALSYLHSVEPPIIHRDIKTNNILLDENFQVKVADFGISRLFPPDATHVSTRPQGTFGYLDPEYFLRFQLTDKSDVYSFGVVMIELISSKSPIDIRRNSDEISLANMAITKIRRRRIGELVDPDLGYEEDLETREMIDQVAQLASRCLQSDAEMRPGIKEVLGVLRHIRGEVDADGVGCDQVKGESTLLSHVEVFSTDYVTGR